MTPSWPAPRREYPDSLFTDEQRARSKRNVKKINQHIMDWVDPGYRMTLDDHSAIVMRTIFDIDRTKVPFIDDPDIRPEEIIMNMDKYVLMGNHFFKTRAASRMPPKRTGQLDIEEIVGTLSRTRIDRNIDTDNAQARDNHKCIITQFADPEMAHIFPNSAVGSKAEIELTTACWEITQSLLGTEFHNRYIADLSGQAVNTTGNVVALTKTLHDWLDRCYWAFKVWSNPDDNAAGVYRTVFQFYWLPAEFADKTKFPVYATIDGPDNTVDRIWEVMEKHRSQGFPPREPFDGDGYIGAYLRGRHDLETGHLFKVDNSSKGEAQVMADMGNVHFPMMYFNMLRGVKMLKAGSGNSGKGDDGRGEGRSTAKDKERDQSSAGGTTKRGRGTTARRGKRGKVSSVTDPTFYTDPHGHDGPSGGGQGSGGGKGSGK